MRTVRDDDGHGLAGGVTIFGENPACHQLLTGFILLHRSGIIDLRMRARPDLAARHLSPSVVEAVVAGRHKIAYDVEDGYIVDWDARNRYLDQVDLCFKRSLTLTCTARRRTRTSSDRSVWSTMPPPATRSFGGGE